jgi:hypothetical protein
MLDLATQTDRWGWGWVSSHVGRDKSNRLTGSKSSPVIVGDGDSGPPEMRRWVESNQETTEHHLVAALWPNGHQSITGGVSARRWTTATEAGVLQDEMGVIDDMGRSRSSPRSCRAWRRGRRWSGTRDRWWPNLQIPSSSGMIRSFPALLGLMRRTTES